MLLAAEKLIGALDQIGCLLFSSLVTYHRERAPHGKGSELCGLQAGGNTNAGTNTAVQLGVIGTQVKRRVIERAIRIHGNMSCSVW